MTLDIIAVLGIVWVLCSSRILKRFREFLTTKSEFIGKLLSCWGCTSFWVGMVFYLVKVPEFIRFAFICVIISVLLQELYIKLKK